MLTLKTGYQFINGYGLGGKHGSGHNGIKTCQQYKQCIQAALKNPGIVSFTIENCLDVTPKKLNTQQESYHDTRIKSRECIHFNHL